MNTGSLAVSVVRLDKGSVVVDVWNERMDMDFVVVSVVQLKVGSEVVMMSVSVVGVVERFEL